MPATMTREGDSFVIDLRSCRGLEFSDALTKVREIPGRRFDFENKLWRLPGDAQTAERAYMTLRPIADTELVEWIKSARTTESEDLTSPLPDDADLLLSWADKRESWQPTRVNDEPFNGLFDYQRAAVDLMARQLRILLADDMGSGKTIMALAAVEEHRLRSAKDGAIPDGPKLVVCPASVKGSWLREIRRWLPEDTEAVVLAGSYPKRSVGTAEEHMKLGHRRGPNGKYTGGISVDEARRLVLLDAIERDAWIIVNWEQIRAKKEVVKTRNGGKRTVLRMKEPLFEETAWMAVIADEIHRAKNRRSQQTRGLHRITGEMMLGLTGTPLMNSPDELWALMRWLWPDEYHERGEKHKPGAKAFWTFYELYVEYWEGGFGKIVTGVKNPDALRFELKDRLIRRTSSQLRRDGRRTRQRLYYEVDLNPRQRKLYDEAVKRMWLEVEQDMLNGDKNAQRFSEALRNGATPADLIKLPNGAARMIRCQQIIESPALLGAEDDSGPLDDLVDRIMDTRPFQWVVFVKFKESCRLVKKRLEKKGLTVGVYNGDVPAEVRTRLEDQFQSGDIDVMVGTIAAMREGITLTSAHLMHFVTRDWVPDINDQCECREDRIGQQNRVTINIPLARNTVVTENVEPTNRRKEGIVKTVVKKDDIEEVRQ